MMQIFDLFIKEHKFVRYSTGPRRLSALFCHSQSSSIHLVPEVLDRPSSISKPCYFLISSIGLPAFRSVTAPALQFLLLPATSRYRSIIGRQVFDLGFLRPRDRLLSTKSTSRDGSPPAKMKFAGSVNGFSSKLSLKETLEIIDAIKKDGGSLESKLNPIGARLSVASLSEIFHLLNRERASALPLFVWVQNRKPDLYRNAEFCSLIIDNCGWLGNYQTMVWLLNDFKSKKNCLTSKAFGFLNVSSLSKSSLMESIRKVIEVLNQVGASCRSCGIAGMIKRLCELDSFEMADFVMEITERKTQYYKVMIREKCNRCFFEEAQRTIEEMRHFGCEPDTNIYNYLLSTLCKNDKIAEAVSVLKEMQFKGYPPPDALTFDILIYFSSRQGKFDFAFQFLNEMITMGIEPRASTHAAFIKGFFHLGRFEEAKEYAVSSGVKYQKSCNLIYTLLADLHQGKGDLVTATTILIEMMEKGLRPNFRIYMKVLKQLHKCGHNQLAGELKSWFSSLELESCTVT